MVRSNALDRTSLHACTLNQRQGRAGSLLAGRSLAVIVFPPAVAVACTMAHHPPTRAGASAGRLPLVRALAAGTGSPRLEQEAGANAVGFRFADFRTRAAIC